MSELVLVATDFSPTAVTALEWGASLARAHGCRVGLLHALDVHGPLTDFLPSSSELDSQLQQAAQQRLEQSAADLRARGLEVEIHLTAGVASQAVVRAAAEHGAALLVQGSRGLSKGLGHLFLGSTAQRVVQHSGCPVLTVHPDDAPSHEGLKRVLVPTDFSRDAENAARAAHRLLAAATMQITLLHAYHLPVEYTAYGTVPTAIPFHADVGGIAEERLAEAAAGLRSEGVTADTLAREGYPPEVIVDAARELTVDVIAMGTHGRTGLRHLLLGSTAERVVEHAPCPVLTVRQVE
jgi:nucleotide-binding universal stress UspA family protein